MREIDFGLPAALQRVDSVLPRGKSHVDLDGWGIRMTCPICRDDYTHIEKVMHSESESGNVWKGQGDVVRVYMFCEGGHQWIVRMGHHKGNTYFDIDNIGDIPKD